MAETLSGIIADHDHGAPVMDVTADVVIALLSRHHSVASEMLTPLVRDQVRRLRRARERHAEDAAFERDHPVPPGGAADPLAGYRDVVRRSFWCPIAGRRVQWGAATVEQHQSRAGEQRALAGSCIQDAERHERAIALITDAGVSCLDDLLAVMA